MKPLSAQRPETRWLLACGALLLVLALWAAWIVVTKYQQAAARLDDIQPRHARLAGLLQGSDRFTEADGAIKANLAEFVYPAEQDAGQTGNAALQRVRDLATTRGLRVSSSQAAAPRDDKGFDRIGLSLRVEGDWPQLQGLLRALPGERPAIYSDTVQLLSQGPQAGRAPAMIQAQLELFVLQERQP